MFSRHKETLSLKLIMTYNNLENYTFVTSNAEEAEGEQFYEDLQDLLELTPQKDVLFIIGDWNEKTGSQETQDNLALEYGMKQGKD